MADNRKRLFALRGLGTHPTARGHASLRGLGVRPRRCSGLDAVAECPAQSGDRLLPIHAAHGRRIGAFAEFAPDEQGQLGAIGKGSAVGTPNCWASGSACPPRTVPRPSRTVESGGNAPAGRAVAVAADIDASRPQQRVHFAFDPGQQRPEFGEGLFRQLVEGRRRLPRAEHAVAGQGRVDPLVQRPVAGLVDDRSGGICMGRRSADGAPTVTRRQGRSSPVLRRFISSMRCRSARRWASGPASHQSRTAELS